MKETVAVLALGLLPSIPAGADTPPAVNHQPAYCTVPEKALSLCATISDDGTVAAARLYFSRAVEKHYAFVDMAFTGLDAIKAINMRGATYWPLFAALALSAIESQGLPAWRVPFISRTYGWTEADIGNLVIRGDVFNGLCAHTAPRK